MVAAGKAEVNLLNKYIKNYGELMFGHGQKSGTKSSTSKEDLFKNMKGFKEVFKDKVTFIAKAGRKVDTEFENVQLEDLIKLENK
jgi:hypothetical protein